MILSFYIAGRATWRIITGLSVRQVVLGRELTERPGPMLLAVTHLSHLEPMFVSALLTRPVRWMARTEFYQRRWAAWILRAGGAFSVNRNGPSLPAIRTAIRLLKSGQVVGMFPEGGVTGGSDSVLRGGPIREGVCTISLRTAVPIMPVVVLGTDDLNQIPPWLPFKRGRVWIAFGREVPPPGVRTSNRADRAQMSERLRAEFVRLHGELIASGNLPTLAGTTRAHE